MSEPIRQRVMDRFEEVEQQLTEMNGEIEDAVEAGVFSADLLEQFTEFLDMYKEIEEMISGDKQ